MLRESCSMQSCLGGARLQVLGCWVSSGKGPAGSCSSGGRVCCLLEGPCSRDRWRGRKGMVDMFDRGGAGVVCGCNTIKMKHKRCFGGEHCLAVVELVPRRPPSTTRLRNMPDHRHINALSLNHGTMEHPCGIDFCTLGMFIIGTLISAHASACAHRSSICHR